MSNLWEIKHPYYMNEGNFYQTGHHNDYENLDDFLEAWGDLDKDLNRVHRWDWREGEDWGIESDGSEDVQGVFSVYFVLQRKAILLSCDVKVRRSDQDRVKEYLEPYAELEAKLWSPFVIFSGSDK